MKPCSLRQGEIHQIEPGYRQVRRRWRGFAAAEEGEQAIEVMLIFGLIILPCFAAILLLQEVLNEYLAVETMILTSPFF